MGREFALVTRLVDFLHLGERGQLFKDGAGGRAFHALDGDVHPYQRDRCDAEQRHEAALPDAGQVVEHSEQDRQHEAAEPADHADKAADGAHVIGIIDRDVLVDRGLAEAHEKAEHEDDYDEGGNTRRHPERDLPLDAVDDIGRRRIGQDERADDRDEERPVHDASRAVLVRKMAAIGAEDRSG